MASQLRPPSLRASLGAKFVLLAVAIFVLALAALLLIQRTQRQAVADLLASEVRERSVLLARVLALTARSLVDFGRDYAEWDDTVRFISRPRPRWAEINLDPALETFNLTSLWVLNPEGTSVYSVSADAHAPRPPMPLSGDALAALLRAPPAGTFFLRHGERVSEYVIAEVQPSDDSKRTTPPSGWLLAERTWDAPHVKLIAELLQCEVALAAPGAALPPPGATQVSLRYPLPGPDGRPAADLIYTLKSRELEIAGPHHRAQLWLFVLACAAGGLMALLFLHGAVLRPLRAIGESLARREPAPILPLLAKGDELGRVAQLVQTSFAQRAELEAMLQERARLGRELHDGVIQTVYAAGMNLAGAKGALVHNPAEAERILDDTHAELNRTIRELRAFIAGLEPEPSDERSFRDSVQAVVALMQGVRPFECTGEIDDGLAIALRTGERLQLLHIVREAVSNSARHSQAHRLRIALRRQGDDGILEISDDGAGFDPAQPGEHGRGLTNLAARAAELGGTLHIDSQPGAGLRLRVTFPAARGTLEQARA